MTLVDVRNVELRQSRMHCQVDSRQQLASTSNTWFCQCRRISIPPSHSANATAAVILPLGFAFVVRAHVFSPPCLLTPSSKGRRLPCSLSTLRYSAASIVCLARPTYFPSMRTALFYGCCIALRCCLSCLIVIFAVACEIAVACCTFAIAVVIDGLSPGLCSMRHVSCGGGVGRWRHLAKACRKHQTSLAVVAAVMVEGRDCS